MIAPAPAMPEPAAAQPAPSIDALFGGGPGALDPGLDQPFANARPAASAVLPGGSGRPSLGGGAAPAVDPMLADTLESAKSPEVADAIAKARAEDQALAQREAEAKAKAAREAAEAQAKRDAAEAKAKREEDERALAQKEAEERARRAAEAQAKRAAKAEERRKAKAAAESAAAKSSDVNADLFSAFDNASKPDPKPDKGSAGPDPNPHLQDSFFPPALENDPAAEVDDEPTPSLLIQLGEIEKNKRQQATKGAIIAVAFILVVAVGLSVYLFVFAGKNDRVAELQEQVASGKVEADKKRGKHFDFSKRKGYSRDQLADMTFVDLGEDDETLKDEPEDAPSEGNPKGKGDAAAKGSKPAPRAGKPIAAKGAAASGTPTKDTAAAKSAPAAKDGGKDDGKAKNLLGVKVDLKSSGSALDKGLDGAKSKAEGKDPKGIAALSSASNDTGATGKKASLEGAAAQKDPAKAGDNASVYNTLFKGTRKVSKVEVEKRKVDPGQSAPTIPSTLTRADLLAGFKSVRRSAFQCVERHLKRSGELPAGKVQVTVTIEGNGRVTGLNMTPPSLKNSVFDSCMRSKRSAWRFPLFQGAPIQVSRKFVLK